MALFTRFAGNPIVRPGMFPWRAAATFNPGVLFEEDKIWLYERAAGGFDPFRCVIGLLESGDGVTFRHPVSEPVFTPEMAGSQYGSVQDPRLAKLDGRYWMTFACRPFTWSCFPTGVGVPRSVVREYPGFDPATTPNQTRSGLAVSDDRVNWAFHSWITPDTIDDRDVILFPDKVNGMYAVLRRPTAFVGTDTSHGAEHPGIMISYSQDLSAWSAPEPVAAPRFPWEGDRIGGATPPIPTNRGWLVFYHGVQREDEATNRVCYRLGAMLLHPRDPRQVVARCPDFLMEPEMYYEKHGALIPNVIFPTGAVVRQGLILLYYGVCDTAIALATAPLADVVDHVWRTGR